MLDRAQSMRRYAQLDAGPQRIGDQRDVLQVRQERPLGLVVGVGNIVTHLPALAGQLANARHGLYPDLDERMNAPGKRRPLAGHALLVNVMRGYSAATQSTIPALGGC